MASRKPIINAMPSKPRAFELGWSVRCALLTFFAFSFALCGCQKFPGGQAMRQYQMESDRLLAEFRAQKKRADDLEVRKNQLEQRLAESERQVALNGNLGGAAGRSTAGSPYKNGSNGKLMIGETRGDRDGAGSLSESKSTRSSTSRGSSSFQRGGLPDALPSMEGRLTSGNMRDPISIGNGSRDLRGDPKSESQWRPVSR